MCVREMGRERGLKGDVYEKIMQECRGNEGEWVGERWGSWRCMNRCDLLNVLMVEGGIR